MVLKQENVNTVTMKNDGIDTSFIKLEGDEEKQQGEYKEHGNSIFEIFAHIPTPDDNLAKVDVYVLFKFQMSFCF